MDGKMTDHARSLPLPVVSLGRIALPAAAEGTRDLPAEVPVAMVYDGSTQAVMMATPADIEDFAWGFALTEGILTHRAQVEEQEVFVHDQGIEARFWLSEDRGQALVARRRAMAGPVGCGLCGIDSLSEAIRPLPQVTADLHLSIEEVLEATDRLNAGQVLHGRTRATHAAGFLRPGQGIDLVREDVGRHNALDKLIGALWRQDVPASSGAMVMTSRVSVELVQKCALAGCPVLIAVSAPTALAVDLADRSGITLIAQARGGRAEIFTHPHRVLGRDCV